MKKKIIITKYVSEYVSDIYGIANTKKELVELILDNLDDIIDGAYVTFAYELSAEEVEDKEWTELLYEITPDYDTDNYNCGLDEDESGEHHHYIIPLKGVEEIPVSLILRNARECPKIPE